MDGRLNFSGFMRIIKIHPIAIDVMNQRAKKSCAIILRAKLVKNLSTLSKGLRTRLTLGTVVVTDRAGTGD